MLSSSTNGDAEPTMSFAANASTSVSRASGLLSSTAPVFIQTSEKEDTRRMNSCPSGETLAFKLGMKKDSGGLAAMTSMPTIS